MKVRKIDLENVDDVERFVQFPFKLYRGNRLWVPPLLSDIRKVLNRNRHPTYQHASADFFIAENDGRTLGRIAVIHNRNHSEYRKAKAAFFGYFEVIEDAEVARALFASAFEWARERGLAEIIGPRGLVGTDSAGLLVEGFEYRPAIGVPYNPAYYERFVLDAGFRKDTDHLSGYVRGDHPLPERICRIADQVKARRGFWIKTFANKDEMRQWAQRVVEVHQRSFTSNFEFFPLTAAEAEMVAHSIINICHPRLVKLVMKGDEIIGFIISYQDISAGLQRARGRLWPIGWLHLLIEQRRTEWVNVNGAGIIPEHVGVGANTVLYTELARTIYDFGFKHADIVLVNEVNFASRSDLETIGVRWYKRHRSYRRDL
jgi:hypothetical protein